MEANPRRLNGRQARALTTLSRLSALAPADQAPFTVKPGVLAEHLGVHTRTVSRRLDTLQDDAIIEFQRSRHGYTIRLLPLAAAILDGAADPPAQTPPPSASPAPTSNRAPYNTEGISAFHSKLAELAADENCVRIKQTDLARKCQASVRSVRRWADRLSADGAITISRGPHHVVYYLTPSRCEPGPISWKRCTYPACPCRPRAQHRHHPPGPIGAGGCGRRRRPHHPRRRRVVRLRRGGCS